MKNNFQEYNSKSDEELIELTVGGSIDASMARTVLDYRKYRETKRQNQLSFGLAILVACITLCQFTMAAFNFFNSDTYTNIINPTSVPMPTMGPTAAPALTITPTSHTPTLSISPTP